MEISEFKGSRYKLAVELFIEGKDGLLYERVLFINNGNVLEVCSYSDWGPEYITEDMAKDEIARSKQVMEYLSQHSDEFMGVASVLPKEYVFCYDYHTGSVMLASEIKGEFAWHL